MVKCWRIGDSEPRDEAERNSERHLNPPQYISLDELRQKTGVLYESINVEEFQSQEQVVHMFAKRGFSTSDCIDIDANSLAQNRQKLLAFYTEHLHSEDEIRLVLNGFAYFDVRDANNHWIRILVEKGDLIVVPAGIYHRFTLDKNNTIKLFRVFGTNTTNWEAINRPADSHPARKQYLERSIKGF